MSNSCAARVGEARWVQESDLVDLAEGMSKLAPPVIQMVRAHQSIRAGRHRTHSRRRHPQQAPRASEDVLQRAEAAYTADGSLNAMARQVGLGHERLSRLLRERGVILRNHPSSSNEIRLMRAMYEQARGFTGACGRQIRLHGGNSPQTINHHRRHYSRHARPWNSREDAAGPSPIPRHVRPCQFQPHGSGEGVVVIP